MRLNDLKPQFVLVIGGAGSGKNYFIEHDPALSRFTLIDVDAMKGEMGVGAAISAIKPKLIEAFEQKKNVAHPTTATNLVAQQNKIKLAKQYGYSVSLILIDAPVEQAIEQVRNRYREGGHDVSLEKIVSSNTIARNNYNALSKMVDDAKTVNNTTVDEAAIPYAAPNDQKKYANIWNSTIEMDDEEDNPFIQADPNLKFLGRGAEAVVVKKNDDGSVIKIQGNQNQLRDDPYLQYILLSKKYMNVNQYFPKVQSIQQVNSPYKGTVIFAIHTEHLVHLDTMSQESIDFMYHQIFERDEFEEQVITFKEFAKFISDSVKQPKKWASLIIDPNFRNAINLINIVLRRNKNAYIDLHFNNMMVRETDNGPQLVITDPVAGDNVSWD